MAIKWTRESYIPKGATKISAKGFEAVVYIYYRHSTAEDALIPYAVGFAGEAQKPTNMVPRSSAFPNGRFWRYIFISVPSIVTLERTLCAKGCLSASGISVSSNLVRPMTPSCS